MKVDRPIVCLGLGYVLLASLVKPSMPFSDLTDFWVPAARLFLEGRPQDLYSIRVSLFGLEFPNSYPPLFFAMLAPFVALADALGLGYGTYASNQVLDGFGAAIVGLPLVLGDVLLAWIFCRLAGPRLGREDTRWLFVLLLLQPLVSFSSVKLQHHESLLLATLLCAVWSLERGHPTRAALLATLALCWKSTAVLALPALALAAKKRQGAGAAWRMLLLPPLGFGLLLLPWLIKRWDQTVYALLAFESMRPIFGISAAKLLAGGPLEASFIRISNPALIASVALGSLWLHARGGGLRQSLAAAYLLGLLASRWVYPHYLLLPCGMLLLWELEQSSFPRWSLLAASLLWVLQSPYFPEITLENSAAVRLRSAAWTAGLIALLAKVLLSSGGETPHGDSWRSHNRYGRRTEADLPRS